jgi:hypothetical protein
MRGSKAGAGSYIAFALCLPLAGTYIYFQEQEFYEDFHSMHTTLYGQSLLPGLTLEQVVKDIFITCNIWAFIYGLILSIVYGFVCYVVWAIFSTPQPTIRVITRLAFTIWLLLCIAPVIAGIRYFLEMKHLLS